MRGTDPIKSRWECLRIFMLIVAYLVRPKKKIKKFYSMFFFLFFTDRPRARKYIFLIKARGLGAFSDESRHLGSNSRLPLVLYLVKGRGIRYNTR